MSGDSSGVGEQRPRLAHNQETVGASPTPAFRVLNADRDYIGKSVSVNSSSVRETCPNCARDMTPRRCKSVCVCGYFDDCGRGPV